MKKLVKNDVFKNILIYSAIFISILIAVLFIFLKLDKSLIWQEDALQQHFLILYDFNEIIRNFLANPSNGIDTFSFNIGLGQDIIGQYSYYVLGDPFAYLSLLFPMSKLEIAYIFIIVVRMYAIGLSFMAFGYYMKLKHKNILIGALIYTFSGFVLYGGIRHPYFLNPVILFPLLLIGVNKLLKEGKIFFLTIVVFISLIINYYFFYMLTMLIGIYILIKFIFEYKDQGFKFLINIALKLFVSYSIAVLMASIIFMPTLYAFFNSSRIGQNEIIPYGQVYYVNFIDGLITTKSSFWNIYGVSSIILLMLPMLFKNIKKNKTIFTCFIIAIVVILFPYLGSMMNGFSFPNNRWIFAFSFLLAYIVALFLDLNFKYSKKDIKTMFLSLCIYFLIIVIVNSSLDKEIFVMLLFSMLFLSVIIFNKNIKKLKINPSYLMIILISLNLYFLGYYLYSLKGTKEYASQFLGYKVAEDLYKTDGNKISKYNEVIEIIKKDKGLYRTTEYPCIIQNNGLYYNTKTISSYFSIGSKYEANLALELNNREYSISKYIKGFDDRVRVTTLLGTKYFVVTKKYKNIVPYGYKLIKEITDPELKDKETNTLLYKNENALPFLLFYDNYVLRKNYDKLSPLNKEQVLLDSVVIDKKINNLNKGINKNVEKEISYKVIDKNKIEKNKNVKTIKEKQSIKLEVDNIKNSEVYVLIKNVKFKPYTSNEEVSLALGQNYNKSKKGIYLKSHELKESTAYKITVSNEYVKKSEGLNDKIRDPYYFENNDILVNLGYVKNYNGIIKINFETKGKYSYDDLKVIAINMENYDKSISKFKENPIKIKEYSNKYIKANINTSKDGIIQVATDYSKGWNVYVDGKKTKTLNVNTTFIGIPVKKGNHEIYLKYKTPYLKEGIILSIVGFISMIGLFIIEKKKK